MISTPKAWSINSVDMKGDYAYHSMINQASPVLHREKLRSREANMEEEEEEGRRGWR